MKNKLKHITLLIGIVFISSCGTHDRMKNNKKDMEVYQDEVKPGFIKATVINYTVDGCSWLIVLEDGKKLQPNKLSPEFQKDNLKVWINYTTQKGGVSICMAAEMATITEIILR